MEGQSSTALSEAGQQQAQQLSVALSSSETLPTHLYSSPLLRATQTAAAITHSLAQCDHAFCYQETLALQELHAGIFQGLTWLQAEAAYPDLCQQLMATLKWQPIPEAETLLAARGRAKSWIEHVLHSRVAGDVVWMVSHEGFMQQLISVVMGCDRTWQIRIPHTAIFEFWLSHPAVNSSLSEADASFADRFNSECWIIRRFNDCKHLSSAMGADNVTTVIKQN